MLGAVSYTVNLELVRTRHRGGRPLLRHGRQQHGRRLSARAPREGEGRRRLHHPRHRSRARHGLPARDARREEDGRGRERVPSAWEACPRTRSRRSTTCSSSRSRDSSTSTSSRASPSTAARSSTTSSRWWTSRTSSSPTPFGTLEAFNTSGGTSTLPHTLLGLVASWTTRPSGIPGHADKMRTMLELGLMDGTPIDAGGVMVAPRRRAREPHRQEHPSRRRRHRSRARDRRREEGREEGSRDLRDDRLQG